MTALDFRPLSAPVSATELKSFRRQNAFGTQIVFRVGIGIAVLIAGAMLVAFVLNSATGGTDGGLQQTLFPAILIGAALAGILLLGTLNSRIVWRRRYRISHFASSNSLVFAMRSGSPSYPGAIFNRGNNQAVTEQLFSAGTRQLDIGNYRYSTGSGKNKQTHDWGYVAIKLVRMLPHMVLDARANNFFGSNLPMTLSRDQVLKLEGDFDSYFTLYCPKEYETDALYVFTPDLMALFIDLAAELDAEIIDDWMFLYSSQTLDLSDPAILAGLFRIIDSVGDKTRKRSAGYADSRIAQSPSERSRTPDAVNARLAIDLIAPRGRRLTTGLPVVSVAIVGVAVLIALVNLLPLFQGG